MTGRPSKFLSGTGYTMHQGPDGMWLDIDIQDAADTDHPFNVKLKGLKFTVTPGTVNGQMPTLGGTRLDAATAPEGTLTETNYIYLKCQHNSTGAFPYATTVEHATSVPANEEEFMYVHLATVTVTSGKAKKTAQVIRTSLAAEYFKCGSDGDPQYYVSQS